MQFQLAQRGHGTDGEFLLRFLDCVQPQPAQINGGVHRDIGQFQPQHTAEDAASFILIQLISLFQTFSHHIVLNSNHRKIHLFMMSLFYYSMLHLHHKEDSAIIPLYLSNYNDKEFDS